MGSGVSVWYVGGVCVWHKVSVSSRWCLFTTQAPFVAFSRPQVVVFAFCSHEIICRRLHNLASVVCVVEFLAFGASSLALCI